MLGHMQPRVQSICRQKASGKEGCFEGREMKNFLILAHRVQLTGPCQGQQLWKMAPPSSMLNGIFSQKLIPQWCRQSSESVSSISPHLPGRAFLLPRPALPLKARLGYLSFHDCASGVQSQRASRGKIGNLKPAVVLLAVKISSSVTRVRRRFVTRVISGHTPAECMV